MSDHHTTQMMKLFAAAATECAKAIEVHGEFHSAHEAYGVLLEEVEEFWVEVCLKRKDRSPQRMQDELIQIAAVAIKAAMTLGPIPTAP
jgi:hypothetical protein